MSEVPEKRVLKQDLPQYEQSLRVGGTAKRKEAEAQQAEYEREVSQYEKEQKAAEEKYQRELAEFNKSQESQREKETIEKAYDDRIRQLQSERDKAVIAARESVTGTGTTARKARDEAQFQIEKQYKLKIETLSREKNTVLLPILLKEEGYPQYAIDKATRAYRSGAALTVGSAVERAESLVKGKQAQAERQRTQSVQEAINAPSYTKEQTTRIEFGTPYLSRGGTEAMQARAQDIKPTPNIITGKQAEKTRAPLTGVDTGQSIMGKQFGAPPISITSTETYREKPTGPVLVKTTQREIPQKPASKGVSPKTNPVALLAGMFKQNVTPAGTKEEPKTILSFQNVSDVKEESGRTLLEFQSQLKTETAPAASVYRGILAERGLKETPLAKRIIETYSSKPTKEFKTRAEAFGLAEAKGRKAVFVNPLTGASFDTQTLKGDQKLAESLGYKFEPTKQSDRLQGPWSFGFPQNYYIIPDAFGVPRKDKSGNPIMVKSRETAEKLSQRFAQKPSVIAVKTPDGPLKITSTPEKEKPLSSFGERSEYFLTAIEKEQTRVSKYDDDVGKLYQAGLEIGKDVIGAGAFLENLGYQGEALIRRGETKTRESKIPEILSVNVGSDVFSGRFQNIPLTVKQYEAKYGKGSTIGSIGVGVVGLPVEAGGRLLISGGRTTLKTILRQDTKLAKKEGIAITSGGKGVTFPSKSWDVSTEPIVKKGIKPTKTTPSTFGKVTTQKPEPHPFGKERRIPYAIRQAQQRITYGIGQVKSQAVGVGKKAKGIIQRDIAFPNRSLIQGRNLNLPNVTRPTRPEFSPLQESIRIGLNVKKTALANKLAEMEKVYRGGIPEPTKRFSPRKTGVLFDLRRGIKIQYWQIRAGTKQTISGVKQIKIPELKTPARLVKLKKEIIFIGKRTSKGIEKRKQKVYKSIIGLKPKKPQFVIGAQRNWEAGIFMQKKKLREFKQEKITDTLAKMKSITEIKEVPKVVLRETGENVPRIVKRMKGVSEPLFESYGHLKSFAGKMDLRKILRTPTPKQALPIVKIGKTETSRKEFAKLLTDEINLPKTKLGKFPFRSKLSDPLYSRYDVKRQLMLKDIYNLSNKGKEVLTAKQKSFDLIKGQFVSSDTKADILRESLQDFMKKPRGIARLRSETMGLSKRGKLIVTGVTVKGRKVLYSFGLKAPSFPPSKYKELSRVISNIGAITKEKNLFVSTQKAERFSAQFTRAGLGGKQKTVKDLIGEGLAKQTNKQRQVQTILDLAKKGKLKISNAYQKLHTKNETIFYHGTDEEGVSSITKYGLRSQEGMPVYITNLKSMAKRYATQKGKVLEFTLSKNAKIVNIKDIFVGKGVKTKLSDEYINFVKKTGKDDIFEFGKYKKFDIIKHSLPNEFIVVNPKSLKLNVGKTSISKIQTGIKVNLPKQIKPIFKIPRSETTKDPLGQFGVKPIKETEVEKMVREAKAGKPKNQFYKRVRIDPWKIRDIEDKSLEKYRAIGITVGAGTLGLIATQPKEAEAVPFASLGRIATRQVESGGQILIYPELKGAKGKPSLIPPVPKRIEQEEEPVQLTSYPQITKVLEPVKYSLKTSQTQKIETSFKLSTVQPQKISVMQRSSPKQKQPTKQRERERYVVLQTPRIRQTQKQTQKLVTPEPFKAPTKQPTRLAQPIKFKQPTIQVLRYREPEPPTRQRPLAALLPKENKIPKSVLKKQKEKADFLGSSSEISISGVFRRAEITYGQKKIARLLKGDVRVVQGKPRATRQRRKEQKDLMGFSKKKKSKTRFW